jgi:hypothetical protein
VASLQFNKLAGVVQDLGIADGPPRATTSIAVPGTGNAPGSVSTPEIVEISAIGADIAITWSTGAVETLQSGMTVTRRMRGEALSVA